MGIEQFKYLHRFITRGVVLLRGMYAGKVLSLILTLVFTSVIIMAAVDAVLLLPYGLRIFYRWCAGISTLSGLVWAGVYIFVKPIGGIKDLVALKQVHPEFSDRVINAVQLESSKLGPQSQATSSAMVEKFVEQVEQEVKDKTSGGGYTRGRKKVGIRVVYVLLISVITFLFILTLFNPGGLRNNLTRVLFPETVGREDMSVLPGNLTVLQGMKVNVELNSRKYIPKIPKIVYWSDIIGKNTDVMAYVDNKKFRYIFPGVERSIKYRITCGEYVSPVYSIDVITGVQVGDISLKLYYPPYTNRKPELIDGADGTIRALVGTRVELKVKVNKRVKAARVMLKSGEIVGLKINNSAKELMGELHILRDDTYWFDVEDENGFRNVDLTQYRVLTVPDDNPVVSILSPEEDLIVSETVPLKVVYHCKDDYGIKSVVLAYKNERDPEEKTLRARITGFPAGTLEKVDDWVWKLASTGIKPGDVIEYWLELTDNDTVTGPKVASSKRLKVEVFSYENEHKLIGKEIDDIYEKLVNVLAKQLAAEFVTKEIIKAMPETDTAPLWQKDKGGQSEVKTDIRDLTAQLSKTLDRMNNDPLSDSRVYNEYRAMENGLKSLLEKPLNEALKKIDERNPQGTQSVQHEIVEKLEKMSILAEDVMENQRMADLLNTARELNDVSSDLTQQLGDDSSRVDNEKQRQLDEMMKKIGEMMDKMAQVLQKQPESLPDEFMNQDAIKNIDLNKTKSLWEQLQDALEKKDYGRALQLAKQLAESMSKMLDDLQKAAESSVYNEMSQTAGKMEKLAAGLDKLIDEQNQLITETAQYENKQLDYMKELQKSMFSRLAEKQKEVITHTQRLRTSFPVWSKYPEQNAGAVNDLNYAFMLMQNVYNELMSKNINKSVEYLKSILSRLEDGNRVFNSAFSTESAGIAEIQKSSDTIILSKLTDTHNATKQIVDEYAYIIAGEIDILEWLSNFEKKAGAGMDDNDKKGLENLSRRQRSLRDKTSGFRDELRNLAKSTAMMDDKVMDELNNAMTAMESAEGKLGAGEPRAGGDNERTAAYHLNQGKEGVQQAAGQMQQAMQNSGTKPGTKIIQSREGTGGMAGTKTGTVKLPGKEEYLPPKEFRQDIMEAMKQKYPQVYEKTIKEYYKRLTE